MHKGSFEEISFQKKLKIIALESGYWTFNASHDQTFFTFLLLLSKKAYVNRVLNFNMNIKAQGDSVNVKLRTYVYRPISFARPPVMEW